MTSGAAIPETISHAPAIRPLPAQPDHWLVVHDAKGNVIVRVDHPKSTYVIGRAELSPGTMRLSNERGINATTPTPEQWRTIEHVLAPLVQSALTRSDYSPLEVRSEPPWVDPEPLEPEDTREGRHAKAIRDGTPEFLERHWLLRNMLAVVLVTVLLVVIGVGGYIWSRFGAPRGSVGNGGACHIDRECRSGRCFSGTCEAVDRRRGDTCMYDSDCASHSCRSHLTGPLLCD
jgi:hypothetical protein